jgi:hypothetical protein
MHTPLRWKSIRESQLCGEGQSPWGAPDKWIFGNFTSQASAKREVLFRCSQMLAWLQLPRTLTKQRDL